MEWKNIFKFGRNKNMPDRDSLPNLQWNLIVNQPPKLNNYNRRYIPNELEIRQFSRNAIVRRAMSVIIDGIVKLPWQIVNEDTDDLTDYTRQIKVMKNIIREPNIVHDYEKFIRLILEDTICGDCGCFEKKIGGNPEHPMYLYPVNGFSIGIVYPYDFMNVDAARYAQMQRGNAVYFTSAQMAYLQKNHFNNSLKTLTKKTN